MQGKSCGSRTLSSLIYSHLEHVGEIEVHIDPYEFCFLERPALPYIWDDAERPEFNKIETTVPSLTDHAWIIMRSSLVNRVFLPRLLDIIEMFIILEKKNQIDFNLLVRRAEKHNIPNIVRGMSYACSRYMGIDPFVPAADPLLKHWEKWSLEINRKFGRKAVSPMLRKELAAVRFLTSPGIASKIRFLLWLAPYSYRIYLIKFFDFVGLKKPLKSIISFGHTIEA